MELLKGFCPKHGECWYPPGAVQECLACFLEGRPDSIRIYRLSEDEVNDLLDKTVDL